MNGTRMLLKGTVGINDLLLGLTPPPPNQGHDLVKRQIDWRAGSPGPARWAGAREANARGGVKVSTACLGGWGELQTSLRIAWQVQKKRTTRSADG